MFTRNFNLLKNMFYLLLLVLEGICHYHVFRAFFFVSRGRNRRWKGSLASKDFVSKYPPSYYHREPARADLAMSLREVNTAMELQHKSNFSSMEKDLRG